MLFYIFSTKAETRSALNVLQPILANGAASFGVPVITGSRVLGRNAKTGEIEPLCITFNWSDPIALPQGLWGIPSVRERFPTLYIQIEAAANLPVPQEATPLSDME